MSESGDKAGAIARVKVSPVIILAAHTLNGASPLPTMVAYWALIGPVHCAELEGIIAVRDIEPQ